MTIDELITIIANRIATLNNMRATSVVSGDIGSVDKIDAEIAETQRTLDQLKEVA